MMIDEQAPAMCPCCGFNFVADRVLTVGDWEIDPRGAVKWKGEVVLRRTSWGSILAALAREQGRPLRSEALLARISDSEDTKVLHVIVFQMRRALERAGVPIPFDVMRGRNGWGYYWKEQANG